MGSNADDALRGVIDTVITGVALVVVLGFTFTLVVFGERPAAHRPAREELLAVVPTNTREREEQPITRTFDQLTGVLEALDALDSKLVLRAEFLPVSPRSDGDDDETNTIDPALNITHVLGATTLALIAPGTSKDAEKIFAATCSPRMCPLKDLPILLISSTSSTLRGELTTKYGFSHALAAVKTNDQLARVIADRVIASSGPNASKPDVTFDVNPRDKVYAKNLGGILVEYLKQRYPGWEPSTESEGKIRLLIGNEGWWQYGPRVGFRKVKLLLLSDGFNNDRVIKNIRESAGSDTDIEIAAADTEATAWARDRRCGRCAFDPRRIEFVWHEVARAAACQLIQDLEDGKSPQLDELPFAMKSVAR